MYPSTSTSSSSKTPQHPPAPRPRSPETFDSLQTRNNAAQTLQSYERLSWHALDRNESLAQTRLHFLSVLAGFNSTDEDAQVDWKLDTTPMVHVQDERGKGSVAKGKERERERGSLGGSGSPAGKGKERSLGGSAGGSGSPGGSGSGSGRKKRRSAGVGS